MLPGILNQLGAENLASLKKLASTMSGCKQRLESLRYEIALCKAHRPNSFISFVVTHSDNKPTQEVDEDDEVPDLVENFDEASKDD